MSQTRTVILISGRGSNMVSLVNAAQNGQCDMEVVGIISNRPNAKGLEFAQAQGIATSVLDHTEFTSREAFDAELVKTIDEYSPDLVILAGFMRILTPVFTSHYANRLLNIHPSILPKYTGLNTHARALAAGDTHAGASVHFVTQELDGGPVVLQSIVPILEGDTEETLSARVLKTEHIIYPMVANWFAQGKLTCEGNQVKMCEHLLEKPLQYENESLKGAPEQCKDSLG